VKVGVTLGQREAVALVGDRPLRVAAVDVPSGEAREIAEVLPPAETVPPATASPPQPRNTHPRSRLERLTGPCLLAATDHGSDDLMAGNDRRLGNLDLPVEQVQVGAANAACVHSHEDLVGSRLGVWQIHRAQHAGALYLYRPHRRIIPRHRENQSPRQTDPCRCGFSLSPSAVES
jgi:hypothetical protein